MENETIKSIAIKLAVMTILSLIIMSILVHAEDYEYTVDNLPFTGVEIRPINGTANSSITIQHGQFLNVTPTMQFGVNHPFNWTLEDLAMYIYVPVGTANGTYYSNITLIHYIIPPTNQTNATERRATLTFKFSVFGSNATAIGGAIIVPEIQGCGYNVDNMTYEEIKSAVGVLNHLYCGWKDAWEEINTRNESLIRQSNYADIFISVFNNSNITCQVELNRTASDLIESNTYKDLYEPFYLTGAAKCEKIKASFFNCREVTRQKYGERRNICLQDSSSEEEIYECNLEYNKTLEKRLPECDTTYEKYIKCVKTSTCYPSKQPWKNIALIETAILIVIFGIVGLYEFERRVST